MRIGINVPTQLMERVKEIEPRVNVSQVCREALEDLVATDERAKAQAAFDGIDEHVARLVESGNAPMIEPDWDAQGFEDAAHWVSTVTPEEWEQFIYQSDALRKQGGNEADMVDVWSHRGENCGLHYRLYDEHREWFTHKIKLQFVTGEKVDTHKKPRQAYARAWLGYVNEIRRKIEQHYRDEYQRVQTERAKHKQSRPEPEIPPQLI